MKNTAKKTLALLLCLVMVIGLLPGMTALAEGEHTHSFTYSAEGDTITATCGNNGCDLTENKVTLTIKAPENLYYNDNTASHAATLENLEEFNRITGRNYSETKIIYYKGSSQNTDIQNNRPKMATYTAKIALNPDAEKTSSDYFTTGKFVSVSFTFGEKPTPHTHSFSYAASGNVITATCNGAGTCDLTNKQATLTLNAPAHTAVGDGKDANATFSGEIPGVNNPTIHYSKGDTPLSAAPTDAGNYTAWCQLGNATASVSYTIATEQTTDPIPSSHTHNFEYSAEGDTITATCGNDGCGLAENKVTLTIGDPTNIYWDDKSSSHEFTLVGLEAFNSATGKTISASDIVYYKGDNQSSDIKNNKVKGTTYKARLTVEGVRAEHSFTFTAKPIVHTHSFTYTANGAVITATCNGAGTCDLTNKQATLTLNAPLHTTYGDGKDANATFTGEIPGVANPTIHYSKGSVTLGSAPTDAGTYTAWCQLGNATARVEYTIAKAINPGWTTLPQAKANLVYTGEPLELITAGTASAGSALYTVGTDPDNEPDDTAGGRPYTSSVPEMTDAGTYYVWCKIDGGKNYTSVAAQKVAVTIGDPASQPRISGFTGTINNANVLTINLRNLPENPRFVVSIADKGSAPLAQSADEVAFALSKEATYIANWNATENRWEVRVKVFGKFLNSKITISVYDGDDAIKIQGFKYGDVGEDTIATSHDISFGDYLQMLSILDSTKYGTLYQTFVAYAAALKAAA